MVGEFREEKTYYIKLKLEVIEKKFFFIYLLENTSKLCIQKIQCFISKKICGGVPL